MGLIFGELKLIGKYEYGTCVPTVPIVLYTYHLGEKRKEDKEGESVRAAPNELDSLPFRIKVRQLLFHLCEYCSNFALSR